MGNGARKVEKWVYIRGYEGLYKISSKGRIFSEDRAVWYGKYKRVIHGKILKPKENSRGYLRIQLTDRYGKRERHFVHRLVAMHFVLNPDPVMCRVVNHIDANPKNNYADNLEWTTCKGNMAHAKSLGHMDRTEKWLQNLRAAHEENGKSVVGTSVETGEEIFFVCLNDCKKEGFQPSCVCSCCQGKRRTHAGYTWRYAT